MVFPTAGRTVTVWPMGARPAPSPWPDTGSMAACTAATRSSEGTPHRLSTSVRPTVPPPSGVRKIFTPPTPGRERTFSR